MKYAIVKNVNGTFSIDSEWADNLNGAKTRFHGTSQVLWNAPDVLDAYVMIVDEQLDCVEGYKEYIHHDPVPAPEPEPEPEPEVTEPEPEVTEPEEPVEEEQEEPEEEQGE